ncbi:hypothetical protein [Acidovorax sp. Root219]|uniref:hypothetical protein n=1 Tax=Acidovorax sp. Root219 TaxID=1736493 RepID=UPI0007110D73|nr:hypothetical protein [Acidovorax sp. Root219]KRC19936.1 hypothetical protein ASE28_28815 [Acidovorax sp. Root219]
MLTQIEWWGGVIFVLGALAYRLVLGALEKGEGYDWYRWLMRLFFVLPGVLLAGYFYPLERLALQYAYLGVLGVALLAVAGVMVQEVTGDADSDKDKAAKAAREGEKGQAGEDSEDEEPGWLLTILGVVVLYSPVLAACGLACHKGWPMVQRLV